MMKVCYHNNIDCYSYTMMNWSMIIVKSIDYTDVIIMPINMYRHWHYLLLLLLCKEVRRFVLLARTRHIHTHTRRTANPESSAEGLIQEPPETSAVESRSNERRSSPFPHLTVQNLPTRLSTLPTNLSCCLPNHPATYLLSTHSCIHPSI